MSRVAVIGSGISGLTAAYRLAGAGHRVTVFEATERVGGAVNTIRKDTEIMEAGPDSLLLSKPSAMELARELGVELVESEALHPPQVVKNGRLLPLPEGFRLLAPTRLVPFLLSDLLSARGKLRAAAELFIPAKPNEEDESIAHFVRRRFGQEILNTLAQPLIGGIYSADLERLSLKATFPFLRSLEQSRGSVIRGMWASRGQTASHSMFWAPRKGMSEIVDSLVARIGWPNIRLSSPVSSVSQKGGQWVLQWANREGGFDGVVFACPAYRIAELLGGIDQDISQGLITIPYSSTASVHLIFDERQIGCSLKGSGFVVPFQENLKITACTFAHRKYPGRAGGGRALFRVHLGGQLDPDAVKADDSSLIATAVEALRPLLRIDGHPGATYLIRHHRITPQYAVGHLKLRSEIERLLARYPTLAFAGNGLHGVGLSDCVSRAEECARSLHAAMC